MTNPAYRPSGSFISKISQVQNQHLAYAINRHSLSESFHHMELKNMSHTKGLDPAVKKQVLAPINSTQCARAAVLRLDKTIPANSPVWSAPIALSTIGFGSK